MSGDMAEPGSGGPNKTCLMFQYVYSTLILIFCTTTIFGLIFTEQTRLAQDVHPGVAFVVLIVGVVWLTMVEGGQGAIVGLAPVQFDLYKDSHPKALICTKICHKGDNLDRYLLGRQFMVILIVFTINMAGEATHSAQLWGFPQWLVTLMLTSGLSMVLFTNMVGQLNSEINACHCMLDYLNNYFAVITVYVAFFIEFSGLLHTAYLIARLVAYLAGKPIETKEPPKSALQNIFFYGRCLVSIAILAFSFAVTLKALFDGNTKMWSSVPAGASVVIFFVLLFVVGVLESMQIAYFAVAKLTHEERTRTYFAKKTCDLLFENKGRGLAAFMIGRQLSVVTCMFFIARITSVVMPEGSDNMFGVSDPIQSLFNTGLLGAVIVAIIGSISWRFFGSSFPMFFVSNPIVFVFLKVCLILEATGVCSGAWVLAAIHKKLANFQRDEVWIGTAEERAAAGQKDDESVLSVGVGHITPETNVGENPIEEGDIVKHDAPTDNKLDGTDDEKEDVESTEQA